MVLLTTACDYVMFVYSCRPVITSLPGGIDASPQNKTVTPDITQTGAYSLNEPQYLICNTEEESYYSTIENPPPLLPERSSAANSPYTNTNYLTKEAPDELCAYLEPVTLFTYANTQSKNGETRSTYETTSAVSHTYQEIFEGDDEQERPQPPSPESPSAANAGYTTTNYLANEAPDQPYAYLEPASPNFDDETPIKNSETITNDETTPSVPHIYLEILVGDDEHVDCGEYVYDVSKQDSIA